MSTLDVSNNSALVHLHCSSNKLTVLDVSNNIKLENLYFDDNNISEADLPSSTAQIKLGTAYNQFASLDLSGCTALHSIYCDFPITAGANSTWELDFTAFKEAYGIDGEFDSSYGVRVSYSNSDSLSNFTTSQSSGRYILRFLRLAEGTLKSVDFRCKLNNSEEYMLVYLVPSVDSASLTAPLITDSSLPTVSIDNDGYYEYYLSA